MAIFNWEGMDYKKEEVMSMFGGEEGDGRNGRTVTLEDVAAAGRLTEMPKITGESDLCRGGRDYKIDNPKSTLAELKDETIGVVALTFGTPGTLLNSMNSWEKSGLLDVVDERVLILNGENPAELALGLDYDFKILRPDDIPNVKMNPKYDNVVTIGAAFYYAMQLMTSDYIIFLEKDFMADYTVGKEHFMREVSGRNSRSERAETLLLTPSRIRLALLVAATCWRFAAGERSVGNQAKVAVSAGLRLLQDLRQGEYQRVARR